MPDVETNMQFGEHVRSLRRARGYKQDMLALRCGLSADTIRRLERGDFSPSLETLRKLCKGFGLQLSTLFEAFELGEPATPVREINDLLAYRSTTEHALALRVLRALFDELDAHAVDVAAQPNVNVSP